MKTEKLNYCISKGPEDNGKPCISIYVDGGHKDFDSVAGMWYNTTLPDNTMLAYAKLFSKSTEMAEALKWFVNAMSDGSLIIFTDDDQHKAVRDDNQDRINEIEVLVKSLES